MANPGSVIFNFENIKGRIRNMENLSRNMGKVGEAVRQLNERQIKNRIETTGRGVKPYSEKYAAKKDVPRGEVTYVGYKRTYSSSQRGGGHMMDDFGVIKTTRNSVEVGFTGTESKRKAAANYELRKFIGLTKKNKGIIFKFICKILLTKA